MAAFNAGHEHPPLFGTDDEVLTLLREVFKIHPLAVEDVKEFHQRPKIEDYDNFVSIVAYGARELGEPMTEVHCFYAERFLVSVHSDDVPAVTEACQTLGRLHTDRRLVALYRLLDALVDTMFLVFGVGTELLAVTFLLIMFRRRGWMGR